MFSDQPKKWPKFLSNITTLENSVTRFYPPLASAKIFSDGQKCGQIFHQTLENSITRSPPPLISEKIISVWPKSDQIFCQTQQFCNTQCYQIFPLIDTCQNVLRWAKIVAKFCQTQQCCNTVLPDFPPL